MIDKPANVTRFTVNDVDILAKLHDATLQDGSCVCREPPDKPEQPDHHDYYCPHRVNFEAAGAIVVLLGLRHEVDRMVVETKSRIRLSYACLVISSAACGFAVIAAFLRSLP